MPEILTTSPTLSYVSTNDMSNDTSGSIQFGILFNESVATLGSVIMFEYKLQNVDSVIPNLENTSFGFVSVENAVQSGIVNQYVISVPSEENTTDGTSTKTIQVRVYTGQKNSADIIVTEWSNQLNVYNPPVTPVIQFGYFDESSYYGQTELFITLQNDNNNYNDYDKIKFIVCYFYQDTMNNTVWNVSEPLTSTSITYGTDNYRLINVPNIGLISQTSELHVVYASVHAVYNWTHESNTYHSVSYVSNELILPEGNSDNQPDITNVVYNIYEESQSQTIDVTWNAPQNSVILFYNISHYNIHYKINNEEFQQYNESPISPNEFSHSINVGTTGLNLSCGDSILFKVDAITVNNYSESSDPSSSFNFFKYAQAPTDLVIKDTSVAILDSVSIVDLTVEFTGVIDKGCGDDLSYVVLINGQVYSGSGSLTYDTINPGKTYSIVYSGLEITQVGNVKVYLETQNTNSDPDYNMIGDFIQTDYIANTLMLDTITYNVYTNGNSDQNMLLNWDLPVLSDWTVNGYDVLLSINSGEFNTVSDGVNPGTETSFTYDASQYTSTVTSLDFKIKANMQSTNGITYEIYSNIELQNTFTYAVEPTNLIIKDTSVNGDSSVNLTVEFTGVTDKGLGDDLEYVVLINGVSYSGVGSLSYISGQSYSIVYANLPISQVGTVSVYLETDNTNSNPSGPMLGASVQTDYIANTLMLDTITYNVYTNGNSDQNMLLNWDLPVLSDWTVNGYDVLLSIDEGDFNTISNGVNPGTGTSFTYNASEHASSLTALEFKIKANMVSDNGITYEIFSNIESQNTFTYAVAPTNLIIKDTSVNNDASVNLTVEFTGVTDKGLGDDLEHVVLINEQSYSGSGSLSYVSGQSYSIVYSNLPISQVGIVRVYLETQNTNSIPDYNMEGASIQTEYIANTLMLDPITYDVYTNGNSDQNMHLYWNPQELSGWTVNGYDVLLSINGGEFNTVSDGDNHVTGTSFTYDASEHASSLTALEFKIKANMQSTNGITYENYSNVELQNTFTYAQAPTNLIITESTPGVLDSEPIVKFTVGFTGVADLDKGLGNGLQYVVLINEELYSGSGSLTYVSGQSYSIEYDNLPISQVGNVRVYLETQNTNSIPNYNMEGDSIQKDYISNSFLLDPITYDVYNNGNNDQDMKLNWFSPELTGWSVHSYDVQLKVDSGEFTNISSDIDPGTGTLFIYNAESYASSVMSLQFRIKANMISTNGTTYTIISNTEQKYTFKYAQAVDSAKINWAVSDALNNIMDINMNFKNPVSGSYGTNNGIKEFNVELLSNTNMVLDTQIIQYVSGDNQYTVNFNDTTYSQNGFVKIYTYVEDTNGNGNITYNTYSTSIYYIPSTLPIFISVNYSDPNIISGQIVSNTLLTPKPSVESVDINGVLKKKTIDIANILSPPAGFNISYVLGDNNEYVYTFSLVKSTFFNNAIRTNIRINVSNEAGPAAEPPIAEEDPDA